jgi:hypothetical protein
MYRQFNAGEGEPQSARHAEWKGEAGSGLGIE